MTTNNQVSSVASRTVAMAGQNRLAIVGATGMVGGYALRYALDSSAVKSVTSIGRKKLGISCRNLKEVPQQNFADCGVFLMVRSGGGRYAQSLLDACAIVKAAVPVPFLATNHGRQKSGPGPRYL